MFTVSLDSAGDTLWIDGFGGGQNWSKGFAAIETADGGYAIAGYQNNPVTRRYDFLIVRVDSAGDTLWTRTLGREHFDEAVQAICETADGGFIAAGGYPYDAPGTDGLYLMRLDAAGNVLWTRSAADSTRLRVYDMEILADSTIVVAGTIGSDIFVMRFANDIPPQPFERVLPPDSILLAAFPYVDFSWRASYDPEGDDITYLLHVESDYADFPVFDAATADTMMRVDIPIPAPGEPLDELYEFHWTVRAAANGDTIAASNGEGLFFMDIIDATKQAAATPTEFGLSVFPNPFNPSTTINLSLPSAAHLRLTIYDILGRQKAALTDRLFPAGSFQVDWSCAECAAGVYLLDMRYNNIQETHKLLLLR